MGRTHRGSDMSVQNTTAASWADGSSSPGLPDRWSLQRWSAGRGRLSRYKLLQTPSEDEAQSWVLPTRRQDFSFKCSRTSLYLVVIKFTVLHVGWGGHAAHTSVSVVVRILTHAVWETLLNKRSPSAARLFTQLKESVRCSYRHAWSEQRAGRVRNVPPLSFILNQDVGSPTAAVHLPLLVKHSFYFQNVWVWSLLRRSRQ